MYYPNCAITGLIIPDMGEWLSLSSFKCIRCNPIIIIIGSRRDVIWSPYNRIIYGVLQT